MKLKDVYETRAEFKKWPYKNFEPSLLRLRKAIEKQYERMRADCITYGHDLSLLATLRAGDPPVLSWHKSDAKWILEQDINKGKHKEMKPAELYVTREEYQAFDLKTFRNHMIYQEVNRRSKSEHRFAKKRKRAAKNSVPPL